MINKICTWLLIFCLTVSAAQKRVYYFVIAADAQFYKQALYLIGTLHKIHFYDIGEIAFFDLGLEPQQRQILSSLAKVTVYDLTVNADYMLTPFVLNPLSNKPTRGHYTWKCAVLWQALALFPYYVYLDAGVSVVGRLDDVFDHIAKHGYFFIDSNQPIEQTMTKRVRDFFLLDSTIVSQNAISANFMGISRFLYNTIITPLYALAQDLSLFVDDGTAPNGYGWSRHDQTLLSILIRQHHLTVIPALSSSSCKWVVRKHIRYSRDVIDLEKIKPHIRYKSHACACTIIGGD